MKYFSLFILFVAVATAAASDAVNRQYPPERQSMISASNAMFDLGYITMSEVTLWLFNNDHVRGEKFTIFAPIESAFISNVSGKREFPLSQRTFLHFSPAYYSLRTLRSKTEIPTISLQYNLIITSDIDEFDISICYVKISYAPIYRDDYVIVYSIEQLFNVSSAKDMMKSRKTIPAHTEL